ncbi:MAG: hypothetical protein IT382_04095 [Deltaproteobacteria bacterium]|nr:hypothetical protein [Deltaproteobacteria bacterium]
MRNLTSWVLSVVFLSGAAASAAPRAAAVDVPPLRWRYSPEEIRKAC